MIDGPRSTRHRHHGKSSLIFGNGNIQPRCLTCHRFSHGRVCLKTAGWWDVPKLEIRKLDGFFNHHLKLVILVGTHIKNKDPHLKLMIDSLWSGINQEFQGEQGWRRLRTRLSNGPLPRHMGPAEIWQYGRPFKTSYMVKKCSQNLWWGCKVPLVTQKACDDNINYFVLQNVAVHPLRWHCSGRASGFRKHSSSSWQGSFRRTWDLLSERDQACIRPVNRPTSIEQQGCRQIVRTQRPRQKVSGKHVQNYGGRFEKAACFIWDSIIFHHENHMDPIIYPTISNN